MPPRKMSTSEPSEPTRRSSRISAQPKTAEPAPKAPAKEKRPSKKRAAEDAADSGEGDAADDGDAPAVKKVGFCCAVFECIRPALEPISVGDVLPSYTLKTEKDEDVDVATLAAEKGVVFFLVPKADTPGCTQQACGFRDIYPDFTAVDYEVYCLSADKPEAQTKWQTKKHLPYPLLSDPKRVLISALGAGEGGRTKRSHFIFEKGGKLLEKKMPVKPADSPKLALEFIQSLGA
ncbi:AhpC-TSA-domain-containing protein [Epithele typhae]|uniref:AhpC-TSA-domain-containing protein n=1 Tax=Epithele typhae TaxID=378194 RepID=UPI0020082D1C|nr:AhpC-TSA-domain-containing protein [Epithele typhae]KAH9919977.1 AhpC-TSA-domain-containing protein [Epithele typhae]